MRKLLLLLLITSSMLFGTGVVTFADGNTIDVNVDYQDHTITVTGNAGLGYRYASLFIVNPDKNIGDVFSDSSVLNWSDQAKTASDGSFSFSYHITGETGLYTAIVGVDGVKENLVATFNYFSPNEVTKTLSDIISYIQNKNVDGIQNIISTKAPILQIDTSEYDALPEANKRLLCEGITNSKVTSINDFKELFNDGVRVQQLNLDANEDEYYKALQQIAGDTYSSIYDVFDGLDASAKSKILTELMSEPQATKQDLVSKYVDKVLFTKLADIKIWGEMEKFLIQTQSITGIDFTDYNKLSQRSEAMKKMFGGSYASIEDIKRRFDTAVKECKAAEKKPSSGGGGGGGGGGSSSGSRPTMYEQETIPTPAVSDSVITWLVEPFTLSDRQVVITKIRSFLNK